VFQRLGAQPKPYRVTFSISNVSKPDHFPARVGEIEFSTQPPDMGPKSSNYVLRYASVRVGRMFATTTVHAQDGRMAGSVASARIGQVLDVIRYDYERKNVQLSTSFLLAKEDRHMLLPLPGTVPNPDSSLTPEQLEEFMRRLQELVGSGTLSADAKDRIYSTFRLYRIGADALNSHERRLRWHVQRIYRARCDIVHSAQRMVDATLLCANLEFYLKTVLSAFLDAFHRHPTLRSPREFFDRQQHALDQITKELKTNQNASLTELLASRDAAAALA
jgi:hypothetical protein